MWWTPNGERILRGAEGQLFREALGMIVDMVRDDNDGLWQFADQLGARLRADHRRQAGLFP